MKWKVREDKERGSCRDCNLLIYNIMVQCLQYDGFVGIEKMKENLAHHNCESFIPIAKSLFTLQELESFEKAVQQSENLGKMYDEL